MARDALDEVKGRWERLVSRMAALACFSPICAANALSYQVVQDRTEPAPKALSRGWPKLQCSPTSLLCKLLRGIGITPEMARQSSDPGGMFE